MRCRRRNANTPHTAFGKYDTNNPRSAHRMHIATRAAAATARDALSEHETTTRPAKCATDDTARVRDRNSRARARILVMLMLRV